MKKFLFLCGWLFFLLLLFLLIFMLKFSTDEDEMKCDTCGDNVATNRCHECPHDHRSCDYCSCDDWQNYCKKNEDDDKKDKPKDDNKNDDNKKPQWEFPEDGLMNLCRTCNMAWMKDDKNPSCKCTPLAPFDFRELCANAEPTVLKQIQG